MAAGFCRIGLCTLLALPLSLVAPGNARAQGFKFEQNPGAAQQAAEAAARQERVNANLSTPCRQAIKNKKIMVIIGEQHSNGYVLAQQQNYGPHFQIINSRLQALGLRTYTPEEIRKQIAQAEIDAYFKNDPDAALSAARRLGASFVLRGLITSQSTVNPVMRVNQVTVGMGFTLAASNGRTVADAGATAASYAGPDVRSMAVALLNEHADEVVSKLYSEYCRNAAPAIGNGSK
ncbi:MAG: hypothetical protein LJE97_08530 [Betaproteobacteria bacterium]|jgi:hypothetical protein|nr:hypothetical protein [Betaproteobacteria bacterium]